MLVLVSEGVLGAHHERPRCELLNLRRQWDGTVGNELGDRVALHRGLVVIEPDDAVTDPIAGLGLGWVLHPRQELYDVGAAVGKAGHGLDLGDGEVVVRIEDTERVLAVRTRERSGLNRDGGAQDELVRFGRG